MATSAARARTLVEEESIYTDKEAVIMLMEEKQNIRPDTIWIHTTKSAKTALLTRDRLAADNITAVYHEPDNVERCQFYEFSTAKELNISFPRVSGNKEEKHALYGFWWD